MNPNNPMDRVLQTVNSSAVQQPSSAPPYPSDLKLKDIVAIFESECKSSPNGIVDLGDVILCDFGWLEKV